MPDINLGADGDPARREMLVDRLPRRELHLQDHHGCRKDHRHAGQEMPDRLLRRHHECALGAHADLDDVACVHGLVVVILALARSARRHDDATRHFFAARSTKVLPPFILWVNGASLIWITTASASTPRFFTSACVMSRIMPIFCSSVRPAAMLTVISGIAFFLLLSSCPASLGPAAYLHQTRRA